MAMAETRKTLEAAEISAARGGGGAALKVATANRLSDGAVVYEGDGEWTERIDGARIADGKDAATALMEDAEREVPLCRVVAPYLIDVGYSADNALRPATYREQIRAFGPSIHPQFGRHEAGS